MAKKSKKVEKETRRLIEGISELVKRKGDKFKFKGKKSKKVMREVRRTCPHWVMVKGSENPAVEVDPDNPKNWKCRICGASFPIHPCPPETYDEMVDQMLAIVNQMQLYSIRLGGDADDTKMILRLRRDLPRFKKSIRQIMKHMNKQAEWDERRKNSDVMQQFSPYSGYNYRIM